MRKTVQRWLFVGGLLSFVSVIALVAVVVSVTADDSGSDDRLLAVLEVPTLGETEAAFLLDGHPVFVVHDLDGRVHHRPGDISVSQPPARGDQGTTLRASTV